MLKILEKYWKISLHGYDREASFSFTRRAESKLTFSGVQELGRIPDSGRFALETNICEMDSI